jgi:hypothetical protein
MPAPSYAAITEPVQGSSRPVSYHLAETWDGLYVPYALRLPSQDATGHPFVFLAYGNGGGGLEWLRGRVATHGYIMERLLDAGYACAWGAGTGARSSSVSIAAGVLSLTDGRAWT